MYMFIFFFSFIKHAQILLSRKFFSSFLSFFFNQGPKINEGFFPKTEKSGLSNERISEKVYVGRVHTKHETLTL